MKEKPTAGSPFFGTFPSDRIPKAKKDVNAHFCIYGNNYCKLYQRIPISYAIEFQELKFMISYGFKEMLFLKLHIHLSLCIDAEL